MKIIKQLSENQFVIELNEDDREKKDIVTIAHDYIRFEVSHGIQADTKMDSLYGPYAVCSNWITGRSQATLSIRQMQEIIVPYLLKHNYMKPEHLLREDGTPNYTWGQEHGTLICDCENHPSKDTMYLYRDKSHYDVMSLEEYENTFTGFVDVDNNKIYIGDILLDLKDGDYPYYKVINGGTHHFLEIIKCKKNESIIGDVIPLNERMSKCVIKQG